MKKCTKKGHVMRCRNVPRRWVNDDGTEQFKIYVQAYCDTCKKERERRNEEFRLIRYAKEVEARSKQRVLQ